MSQSVPYVLNCVTPPAGAVITIADLQTVLRVADPTEAGFLFDQIIAATELVQGNTGKQLLLATYEMSLTGFPAGEIEIPNPPLQSVVSIKYDDDQGAEQTLSPSLYSVNLGSTRRRGSIIPADGCSWPTARCHNRSVHIRFTCGWPNAAAVPRALVQQVRLLAVHWFRNRSAVSCGSMSRSELAFDVLQQFNEIKEFV